LELSVAPAAPPLGRNAVETLDVNVEDDDAPTGKGTPKEDAVLSMRRNEVAMASLIIKL
jgi:hypothetical protein